jgi:hypothetical protein
MFAIIFVVILVALAVSAVKWGADSREGADSLRSVRRQAWFGRMAH